MYDVVFYSLNACEPHISKKVSKRTSVSVVSGHESSSSVEWMVSVRNSNPNHKLFNRRESCIFISGSHSFSMIGSTMIDIERVELLPEEVVRIEDSSKTSLSSPSRSMDVKVDKLLGSGAFGSVYSIKKRTSSPPPKEGGGNDLS
jgi:hypothetical protein